NMLNQLYSKKPANLYVTVKENCAFINEALNQTEDLEVNDVTYDKKSGKIIYLHTITDLEKLEELFNMFKKNMNIATIKIGVYQSRNLQEIISFMLEGKTILFLENKQVAFAFDTRVEIHRSLEEPDTEKTVRGSHIGFIEDLNTNLYLIRDRIRNENLKIKYIKLGFETNRKAAIVYMDNLANK